MASTVPRARVAYWPHEQVQKGIRQTNASVKYRGPLSAGAHLQLHRLAPTAGRLLFGNSTRYWTETSCDLRYRNLTRGSPHVRKDQAVRDDRKPFTATGCSGNCNAWAFQRLNIARICCFLRMNTIVAYPLERIEPSPLSGLPSFQRKVVSLSCY